MGPYLSRFEREFAAACGSTSAVSVCNGTVALHLALLALDVRPGDEVLIPSLTFVATANAVRYVGAEPVFVDVDPATWCIDPQLLEASITRRTRGIIAVHLYGHPADMDAINHIAAVHGLWVVEDAAEAHFAKYKGRPVGGLGKLGTFSFYGNKTLTSGEGGAVMASDPQLDLRLRTLRGQGVDPERRYFFPVVGYNFRLTNVAAAILCAQLERAESLIAERRRVCERYAERLRGAHGFTLQPRASWAEIAPWMFCVLVGVDRSKSEIVKKLASSGVETRPFFIPLHKLPPYREQSRARGDSLPWTDQLSLSGLNLPTYPQLKNEEIDEICELVLAE